MDSTIPVTAERSGLNARQAVANLRRQIPDQEFGISVVSLVELAHGVARANTAARSHARHKFLLDLKTILPVFDVTEEISIRAGTLDGEMAARGLHVALADLLIGVTALQLGYSVATHNVKHFKLIPGLDIVEF